VTNLLKWIILVVVQNTILLLRKSFTVENVFIVVNMQLEGVITVQNTVVISLPEKICAESLD